MMYEERAVPGYTAVDEDCPADSATQDENTGEDIHSYG